MKLLLDIGNTTISWAYCDLSLEDGGDYFVVDMNFLESQFERAWAPLDAPECILVSNVSGNEIAERLASWCESRWGIQPEFVTAKSQECGVSNAYLVPERLGTDRWVALIAAVHKYPSQTCCVVDCGTAITFDVVNEAGEHLGGLIVPGLGLMRTVLLERTNIKVNTEDEGNISLLARDTADAIQGGTLYTVVASIDRILADVEDALDCELVRIITGGDAAKILPLLKNKCMHEPALVLEGLLHLSGDASGVEKST